VADSTRILFLCTGNSCRSQMAEGWARALKADRIAPYSAGIEARGLDPRAVKVMAEAGVDISDHRSKTVDELDSTAFDYVITLCGHANETCPMWLRDSARVIHVGFEDPPALAKNARDEEEALNYYRRVRDEIRVFVESLPESLSGEPSSGRGHARIRVTEPQLRSLAATLSLLDQAICRFDEYAAGRETRSVLYREQNTLSPEQRARLRAKVAEIKALLKQIGDDLGLPVRTQNVGAQIWGESAGFWNMLAEMKSSRLNAYGRVDPALAEYLDPRAETLIAAMQEIAAISRTQNPG